MEKCIRFIAEEPIEIKGDEGFEVHYALKVEGNKVVDAECTVMI